jgi:hypothetical protein
MKNHINFDSVGQGPNILGHDGTAAGSTPHPVGAEQALLAQLELFKHRETNARTELARVRADAARVRASFEGFRDDVAKRASIQLEIHGAEQDHLRRIISDLETSSLKAETIHEQQLEESSALNTRMLLRVADLEASEEKLEAQIVRMKSEIASYSKTMVKKETFGRDKARRLDTALTILAQERSKITSLQESSSMRIGRLITSSLKKPRSAFALIWRLPRMIYLETKKNTGETEQ